MMGCCPCCGGRRPKDGAGRYAPVGQEEEEDVDEDDWCDDAPQAKGLDDPFAALQALRHIDFDAGANSSSDDDLGGGGLPTRATRATRADAAAAAAAAAADGADAAPGQPVRSHAPQSLSLSHGLSESTVRPRSDHGHRSQLSGSAAEPASAPAPRAEAGRRGLTIGDMEIDIGWRKPAANEVLSAAAAKARSGLGGGSPSKTDKPKAHYGRGQQHPAAMRQLIGGGTAHPDSMTRQLKMKFDPAASSARKENASFCAIVC